MSQIELSLHTTNEGVDWVRSLMAANDYTQQFSVERWQASSTIQPSLESADWAFTLRFYLPNDGAATTQVEQLKTLLSPLHRTGMTTLLEATDVAAAVALNPPMHRIGQRFLVAATEQPEPPTQDSAILLRLQPSLAFGSGFHPATQLVLELLERFIAPTMQTLDLGCGSGILSVAMAKLGATVLALDNDPTAIAATQAAVWLNQVEAQVNVLAGSLGNGGELGHWLGGKLAEGAIAVAPTSTFDLIAANVLGRIHVALAADYWTAFRSAAPEGGILITAGFTDDYASQVDAALGQVGFVAIEQARSREWVAFAHRRPC